MVSSAAEVNDANRLPSPVLAVDTCRVETGRCKGGEETRDAWWKLLAVLDKVLTDVRREENGGGLEEVDANEYVAAVLASVLSGGGA